MQPEKVDTTFVDRTTKIDNILMEEMLPVLKKLQTGDIVVQMAGTEGEDTLQKLLDIAMQQHIDDTEIIYFTYPNDGGRTTINAGDTTLNYRAGTIKDASGNVTRMSSSLADQKKDFLRSMAIVADKDVVIQLDDKDKSPVRASVLTGYTYNQFQELIITATEDTEVSVFACTNPKHSYVYSAESTISVGREERKQIVSDKDTHFTGAIAQNANEQENLTDLESNDITIVSVGIQSDQALKYRLWFYETDGFDDTNLDDDYFLDFIDLDLVTNDERLGGANQRYFAVHGLNIDYTDRDASNELHVVLENLSATAKNAGATGEVKLQIKYTPRR